MAKSVPAKAAVVPTLTPQRATELLRRQIDELDRVSLLQRDDPEVNKWKATTDAVLKAAFGSPSDIVSRFQVAVGAVYMNMSASFYQREFQKGMSQKRAVLESAIEQLEILAPPLAQVAPGTYHFHAEIERVSGHLFRDGHYKQAAFEAYVRVIDEVKRRSGFNLDGDNLMNQAFSCDGGRIPVLKFNSLNTDEERDEQKGFMFLFKGIVGLRNSKAHSNRLLSDPLRAHDYLSLASLLMRLLEQLST
jgi:uncharacterized protein (TIGR02391 family)